MKKYIKAFILVAALFLFQTTVYAQDKSVSEDKSILEIDKSNLENALFVGDSYTARLSGLDVHKNYGIDLWATGGYTAADLLKEVDSHKNYEPSKIVVLVGINDLATVERIEDVSVKNETKLIDELEGIYNVPIYVQLVFPPAKSLLNAKPNYSLEKLDEYNNQLKEFCDQNGYYWIDTRDGLLDNEGYLKYTDDFMHISDEHYPDFLNNISLAIGKKEKEIAQHIDADNQDHLAQVN